MMPLWLLISLLPLRCRHADYAVVDAYYVCPLSPGAAMLFLCYTDAACLFSLAAAAAALITPMAAFCHLMPLMLLPPPRRAIFIAAMPLCRQRAIDAASMLRYAA